MLKLLILNQRPTFLTGFTGVGKSLVAQRLLFDLKVTPLLPIYLIKSPKENHLINPVFLNFSAQTSSQETQASIESKLNKKFRTVFGARHGEKVPSFLIFQPSFDNALDCYFH